MTAEKRDSQVTSCHHSAALLLQTNSGATQDSPGGQSIPVGPCEQTCCFLFKLRGLTFAPKPTFLEVVSRGGFYMLLPGNQNSNEKKKKSRPSWRCIVGGAQLHLDSDVVFNVHSMPWSRRSACVDLTPRRVC